MLYGDGLVLIGGEGQGLQISYIITGPIHAGILHAPPSPLPGTAIGEVEVSKSAAPQEQNQSRKPQENIFFHSRTSFVGKESKFLTIIL